MSKYIASFVNFGKGEVFLLLTLWRPLKTPQNIRKVSCARYITNEDMEGNKRHVVFVIFGIYYKKFLK